MTATDVDETASGTDPLDANNYPGSGGPGPDYTDSDGDGYTDTDENTAGTDPNNAASYPGSTPDPSETPGDVDSDGDGASDADEVAAGTDPDDANDTPAPPEDPGTDPGTPEEPQPGFFERMAAAFREAVSNTVAFISGLFNMFLGLFGLRTGSDGWWQ